jgi:hypothetical protein
MEADVREILEPHVGENILVNVEDRRFKEASLHNVKDSYFTVGFPETGYFYSFPYSRVMAVMRPPRNRAIEVKWGASTYPLRIEVEHAVGT